MTVYVFIVFGGKNVVNKMFSKMSSRLTDEYSHNHNCNYIHYKVQSSESSPHKVGHYHSYNIANFPSQLQNLVFIAVSLAMKFNNHSMTTFNRVFDLYILCVF